MAHLSLSLLGSFQAVLDGQPIVHFESNKARALLAYLAAEADRPHRREMLAALLWPDQSDRAAYSNLRNTLSRLRKAIADRDADPPHLLVSRETIQFNRAGDCWIDVQAFQDRVATGRESTVRVARDWPLRPEQWAEAISLYRGDFLEGFSVGPSPIFEDWSLLTRERLLRGALATLHRLVTYLAQRGEYGKACDYAWRHVELAPWDESAHRQLMRILALDGQRNTALAQYESCCRALEMELDVEPEEATIALYERIRTGGELLVPVPRPPHNLPAQLAPFVGRENELAEIEKRLADPGCRLLSLVGPGGSGKTRLALEAAAVQRDRYPHGVFLVSLAPLQSAEAILPAIAQATGFAFAGGRAPKQQLLDYLRRKRMLLVLDNAEHLLQGHRPDVAGVTIDLLNAAPEVKVVVTSRVRLNVPGEQLLPVGGMDIPPFPSPDRGRSQSTSTKEESVGAESKYSAVALFVQSARRVQPDFLLTGAHLSAVIRICRLVRGMPLGLLLAATWVRTLSPAEIATEIERGLDFLATDWREVPERHTSVRAVFDHSWSLLSEHERAVLAGLSVFRGGFTREAARQVSGASLRDLMALANHSLVTRSTVASAVSETSGRFEIHELLRQYAAEKLAHSADKGVSVRDRHSTTYMTMLGRWEADLRSDRQLAALAKMDVETENARVAWAWAVEREHVEQLDRAVSAMWRYAYLRGQQPEYGSRFGAAVQMLSAMVAQATMDGVREASPELVEGIRVLAWLLAAQSICDRTSRIQLAQQSLTLLEHPELRDRDTRTEKAFALFAMGFSWQADWALEQSLVLYRELNDHWYMAFVLCSLSWRIPRSPANYDRIRSLLEEDLSISRTQGDLINMAHASHGLAQLALHQGRLDLAEGLGLQTLDLFQRLGTWLPVAWVYDLLSTVAMAQGQFPRAHALMQRGSDLYDDLGDSQGNAQAGFLLGTHKMHLGHYAQARRLGEHALALSRGNGPSQIRALLLLGSLSLPEGSCGRTRTLLEGQDLTAYHEQGGRHVLDHGPSILACALRGLGLRDQARKHLVQALQLVPDTGAFWPLLYALAVVALLLIDEGEAERAVELYALALRYPFVANSRWFEDVAGRHIVAAATALPLETVQAAKQRGRARDLDATVKELAIELAEAETGPVD